MFIRRILAGILGVVIGVGVVTVPVSAQQQEPDMGNSDVTVSDVSPGVFCGFLDVPYETFFTVSSCWLLEAGITTGTSPTTYSPSEGVSRAQIATFLWRAAGSPVSTDRVFEDEAAIGMWARAATDWVYNQGITSDDPFNPAGAVSRADMALWLWKAAGEPGAPNHVFEDEASIPVGAREATDWLYAQGITTNDPYNPAGNVNRAQMSAFLWRWKDTPVLTEDTLSNTDGSAAVLWYNTRAAEGRTVTLPINSDGNITVDWGDGTTQSFTNPTRPIKSYDVNGYYRVKVTGDTSFFGFDTGGGTASRHLVAVSTFGDLPIVSLSAGFYGATNLERVPARIPDVSNMDRLFTGPLTPGGVVAGAAKMNDPAVAEWDTGSVTDMTDAFAGATAFNQSVDTWNTGNVTSMKNMFSQATAFNQPVGNWDTGNVTDMGGMFSQATAFNQSVGNWNTGNVTSMKNMFSQATAFNQPIGNWDTGNVTDMGGMFSRARSFSQPVGNWDTANVTDMAFMFDGVRSFNQPVDTWNTGNVTNMKNMFSQATAFNQPVGNWNTANVTDMGGMFSSAITFNQPISFWDTANVTDMGGMFQQAVSFNQPIGFWDTSNVTDMGGMFQQAVSFNQPIGFWNTGNVTDMGGMFQQAVSFNQTIRAWNTGNVTNMVYMFDNTNAFNRDITEWDVVAVAIWSPFRTGSALATANTPPKFR